MLSNKVDARRETEKAVKRSESHHSLYTKSYCHDWPIMTNNVDELTYSFPNDDLFIIDVIFGTGITEEKIMRDNK